MQDFLEKCETDNLDKNIGRKDIPEINRYIMQ